MGVGESLYFSEYSVNNLPEKSKNRLPFVCLCLSMMGQNQCLAPLDFLRNA